MWSSLKVSLLLLSLGLVLASSSLHSVDAAFFEPSSSSKSAKDASGSTNNSTKKSGTGGGAFFIKQGNKYTVTSRAALDLHETLPVATYTVGMNPITGEYYLQTIDPFDICDEEDDENGGEDGSIATTCTKIYGDTKKLANRILRTYLDRGDTKSTGVLLAGEKGSGKTFLAKYISTVASKKHNIPTVVINQPLHGERFNAFIQSIQQPVIFLFDEFEKIYSDRDTTKEMMRMEYYHDYDDDEYNTQSQYYRNKREISNHNQDAMLTLLDGVYPAKMLFLLTTNDKYKVSNHMRNRPGRIYYVIDFEGLSSDFIREYCEDNLSDKTMIPQVIAVSSIFEAMNFDMLQAMVEEMNRYGETPQEVLQYLNVRPEFGSGSKYKVQLIVHGKEISTQYIYSGSHWYGNPLMSVVHIRYQTPHRRNHHQSRHYHHASDDEIHEEPLSDDEYDDSVDYGPNSVEFKVKDIEAMDSVTGTIWYYNEELNARLVLTKDTSKISRISDLKNFDVEQFTSIVNAKTPPPTPPHAPAGNGGFTSMKGKVVEMQ